MQLLDGKGEACVGAVNAEEDHGNVLRGEGGGCGALGGAVVRVTLVEGQRMVLPAGELLPLQNPAVKNLRDGMSAVDLTTGKSESLIFSLSESHSQILDT